MVRFDLGPLLQGPMRIAKVKLKSAYNSYFLLRKIALPYPHKCLVWFCGAKRIDRQVFFKRIFLSAGDPLSAHVRACAVLIVDRQLSRDLHYIFGRYGSNTYFLLLSSIYRRRSMKFEACKRAPTCIYPLFDWYYH